MSTYSYANSHRREFNAIQDFYSNYMETLDDERINEWPDFFTEKCLYKIISRENYDENSSLCLIQAEGKGMLDDRVLGILKTQKFGPQRSRRFNSGLKISQISNGLIHTRQNVLVIQSLLDHTSSIILCGSAYDQLLWEGENLLLKQRIVVADTDVIDHALIFPI